jgi:hypothetical protein
VNRSRTVNVVVYLSLAISLSAPSLAGQPFNSCRFSIDNQGFIVIEDELPMRRFFPLASFFYPVIGPELDPGNGGGQDLNADYAEFAGWGGNCVICPWDINDWFYGPGALFEDGPTNNAHLAAAYFAHVKLIADPTLFWGRYGSWPEGFSYLVSEPEREQWFNEFKGWCEAGYASALLGYWQWHEPAWFYWRCEGPLPARPTTTYLEDAYNQLRYALEGPAGASHGVFMGQAGYVHVQELWRDYFKGSDCAAALISPCPAPGTLQNDPYVAHLLPNYNCSVVGDLADVVQESARGNSLTFPAPRNQPYIAVLQGHINDGESSIGQCRFMAYDAIIHGAKGLAWYTQYGGDPGDWYWPGKLYFLPVIQELRNMEASYGLLTADYDSPLVRVITEQGDVEVERSAFVGGKLVPKSHFLSSKRIMEGCAKISEYQGHDYTFLIVACRPPPADEYPPPPPYDVEFYPYYSAYDYRGEWEGPAYKLNEYGTPIPIAVNDGVWTDSFLPEEVNIYFFEKAAPWEPE